MKKKSYKGLHTLLFFFFVVIGVVPMVIMGFIAHNHIEDNQKMLAASEGLRFTSSLLTDMNRDNVTAAVAYEDYSSGNELKTDTDYLVVADFDGSISFTTRPSGFDEDIADTGYFARAKEGNEDFAVVDDKLVTYTSLGYTIALTYQDLATLDVNLEGVKKNMIAFGLLALVVILFLSLAFAHFVVKE